MSCCSKEYGRLLELLLDPITRAIVVPPPILDALWHDRILHSCSYFAFYAAKNNGKYLHHVAATAKLPLQPTLRAYASRFGQKAPVPLWGCLTDSSYIDQESGNELWIDANDFLCTTDHVHSDMPLNKFAVTEVKETSCGNYLPRVYATAAVRRTCRQGRSFVSELAPAFSAKFCKIIQEAAARLRFDIVEAKYSGRRRYSGLLTGCPELCSALWTTLRPVMEQLPSAQPSHQPAKLWDSAGRPMARVRTKPGATHQHVPAGRPDGLHLDSQFCPTSHRRSLLTLSVYLTSAGPTDASARDFSGGESRFYVPKARGQMPSVAEWVRSAGGLGSGWDAMTVTPERGAKVVVTQDLMREGAPVLSGTKVLLRTDVMTEVADYHAAMSCFREA